MKGVGLSIRARSIGRKGELLDHARLVRGGELDLTTVGSVGVQHVSLCPRAALGIVAVNLEVAVVVDAVPADLPGSAAGDLVVVACSHRGYACVDRARIIVVARQYGPACAGTEGADVVVRTRIAVIAGHSPSARQERTALNRIARVGRADVVVVAHDGGVRTGRGSFAPIDRACIAVIARDRNAFADAARVAGIADGQGIAIVADRPREDDVLAARGRVARIRSAGIRVVAVGGHPSHADATN